MCPTDDRKLWGAESLTGPAKEFDPGPMGGGWEVGEMGGRDGRRERAIRSAPLRL